MEDDFARLEFPRFEPPKDHDMAEVKPAQPAPKKPIPWIGNLYGAIDWSGTPPAAPQETPAPKADEPPPAALPVIAAVKAAAEKASTPFAPVTVHVHTGGKAGKPKPKAKPAAETETTEEGEAK